MRLLLILLMCPLIGLSQINDTWDAVKLGGGQYGVLMVTSAPAANGTVSVSVEGETFFLDIVVSVSGGTIVQLTDTPESVARLISEQDYSYVTADYISGTNYVTFTKTSGVVDDISFSDISGTGISDSVYYDTTAKDYLRIYAKDVIVWQKPYEAGGVTDTPFYTNGNDYSGHNILLSDNGLNMYLLLYDYGTSDGVDYLLWYKMYEPFDTASADYQGYISFDNDCGYGGFFGVRDMEISSDGSKLFLLITNTGESVYVREINLTTSYDVTGWSGYNDYSLSHWATSLWYYSQFSFNEDGTELLFWADGSNQWGAYFYEISPYTIGGDLTYDYFSYFTTSSASSDSPIGLRYYETLGYCLYSVDIVNNSYYTPYYKVTATSHDVWVASTLLGTSTSLEESADVWFSDDGTKAFILENTQLGSQASFPEITIKTLTP